MTEVLMIPAGACVVQFVPLECCVVTDVQGQEGRAVHLHHTSATICLALGNLTLEKGLNPTLIGPSSICFPLGKVSFGEASWSKSALKSISALSFSGAWDTVWLILEGIFWQCWEKQGQVFNHVSLQEHFPVNLQGFQGTSKDKDSKLHYYGQLQEGRMAA